MSVNDAACEVVSVEARGADADAGLLARLQAGDVSACEELVRRHGPRMLAVARRLLRSEADADDAVQDAFLSAFRAIGTFAGDAALSTWLHRIVLNACLMRLRSRSRRKDVPLDDLLPSFDETGHHVRPVRPWADLPVAAAARTETRARVRACIDRLPEGHRTILLLRDIEELSTEETASRLGIRPGAVKTRLHRARQALREMLAPLFVRESG
jgi:RNA polymerase sigma-70 factor (ECF subfamily)